ncbi:MAG: FAD-binding oxidoreductase [Planctomycetota bacterium]|nr:FAD-binding oxidoreductase [Planctomycetota bacterium]
MAKAVVIGAGAVGIATASYLQREGWSVTVVDREPPGLAGASFGNSGMIATHIVEPIAVRSILPKLPRMLLDPTSPLAIRWWYLPTLLPWLVRLLKATAPAEVERISYALGTQLAHADEAYRFLIDDAEVEPLIQRKGIIDVYPDMAFLEENAAYALDFRRRNGVPFVMLGDNALRNLMPALSRDYGVGVHFTAASHTVDPFLLVSALAKRFEARGGRFHRAHATGFETTGEQVTAVRTDEASVPADLLVLAAGIWSRPLALKLGSLVPLDSERGYHVMLGAPGIELALPVTVGDVRFSVTPMASGIRVGGTIEFAGLDAPPNPVRHEALLGHARRVFPGLKTEIQTRWMGHRPSLPDSMPVIGPSPHLKNVYFGFGHGHLGLTSAAITGRAITDMAAGRRPPFDPTPFRVDRF